MPGPQLENLNPQTLAAPASRILDAASLNQIVKRLILDDGPAALNRVDVQKMYDGSPPYDQQYLDDSGQGYRCNLNFGDGKARIKSEMAGYYDLTDSVPVLARIYTPLGDDQRTMWGNIMSEEFHRMIKDWKSFNSRHQLLIGKMVPHGLGFLYFPDDLDWRWAVAGLNDFKLPRTATLDEDECDVAIVLREIPVGKFYSWIKDIPDDDKRWDKTAVKQAIVNSDGQSKVLTAGEWEKWETMLKSNDIFASVISPTVKVAYAWVREFSGKVTQYITLQDGTNTNFLFKCFEYFASVDQCFTFFAFEIGTDGMLHAVRGLAHEIYPTVQVLNTLRCQTVDNAKFSGSLLLQPKTQSDAEDMALLFYGGAVYIPPGVQVQNGQLNNPSSGILPIIQDMTLTMRRNTGDTLTKASDTSNDKTKFEVQAELMKEAILPTSSLDLFYQPWGRHLSEVWRRCRRKDVTEKQPGGKEILAMRQRCIDRGVPIEAILAADQIHPMRAIGYGSPTNRLMAFDEFMQYFGSLDPVGQNNLLRDRFAQRVGYQQVDDYVPRIQQNGRTPLDVELAELQNAAMSQGTPVTVLPNDQHILHLQQHNPSLDKDLQQLEQNEPSDQLLAVAQLKLQHIQKHEGYLVPDKLNEAIVNELKRQINNLGERVQKQIQQAARMQQKRQQEQAQQPPPLSPKAQEMVQDGQVRRQIMLEDHQQRMKNRAEDAQQRGAIHDALAASKISTNTRERLFPSQPAPGAAVAPAANAPAPVV